MRDAADILGEERIIDNISSEEDPILKYINSFDNILYSGYSYSTGINSCIGIFSYNKNDRYYFAEFGYSKENKKQFLLVVNDYPNIITYNNYKLTNDKFNDLLNLHNISNEQFFSLIGENKIKHIKTMPLKKITLDEYIEIFPHRYINNRIKMYNKYKYQKINVSNISKGLVYRCPYCGANSFLRILNNDISNLEIVYIKELDDDYIYDHKYNFYVCRICNLIVRNPNDIMDFI